MARLSYARWFHVSMRNGGGRAETAKLVCIQRHAGDDFESVFSGNIVPREPFETGCCRKSKQINICSDRLGLLLGCYPRPGNSWRPINRKEPCEFARRCWGVNGEGYN